MSDFRDIDADKVEPLVVDAADAAATPDNGAFLDEASTHGDSAPAVPSSPLELRDAELLRAFLEERDMPCPGCQYNLRGLRTSVCPECGEVISLKIAGKRDRPPGHLAGLVGLSSSTVLLAAFAFARFPRDPLVGILGSAGAALLARALYRWHRDQHTMSTLTRRQRYERIALCWSIGLVIVIVQIFAR